ncbi:beta-lactamase-like protein [Aspergillus bertholletiae]|uniref:Beta-lactamase-like protein n=1 Tax=Aspergillus bertholletiae TaxID=1226010 RepID=A0A5N7BNN6_9EURO|nr:beta-lactamase-like protein [Aspergillus bertholletiae]
MSPLSPPANSPPLGLPPSNQTVDVKVIDSTARIRVPMTAFVKDQIPGHEFLECPSYTFLVEHISGQKVLFDLGVRKDINGFPPVVLNVIKNNIGMTVENDIATILENEGTIKVKDINAIIWSHWHMDHSGDPSTFPSTTSLVVGPGFKENMLPGYPINPMGRILESDYQGRELCEIDFESRKLQIGRFRAFDYFGDGSFYLLDSPGHTVGHMCALARTTPSTFIFMGGDACHHCGSLRPTEYIPLPNEISPSPFSIPRYAPNSTCPGTLLEEIHPHRSRVTPFYTGLAPAPDRNVEEAEKSLNKMADFDASEDVFVAIAHDSSLLDIIDFFPKKVNDWKEKGWKEASRWRFLEDFHKAVPSSTL